MFGSHVRKIRVTHKCIFQVEQLPKMWEHVAEESTLIWTLPSDLTDLTGSSKQFQSFGRIATSFLSWWLRNGQSLLRTISQIRQLFTLYTSFVYTKLHKLPSEQTTPHKPTHVDFLLGIFGKVLHPGFCLTWCLGMEHWKYSSCRASPGPLPSTSVLILLPCINSLRSFV